MKTWTFALLSLFIGSASMAQNVTQNEEALLSEKSHLSIDKKGHVTILEPQVLVNDKSYFVSTNEQSARGVCTLLNKQFLSLRTSTLSQNSETWAVDLNENGERSLNSVGGLLAAKSTLILKSVTCK